MNCLRMSRMVLIGVVALLLGGCLTSDRPNVTSADLLALPLDGNYEVLAAGSMFDLPGPGQYRARIETLSPGSYRLTISPPKEAKQKQPDVYDFRVIGGGDGEYLAMHELPGGESNEPRTHYVLIRAAGPDVWSINSVEPEGDLATLVQATHAVGLGLTRKAGSLQLTGSLTAKALVGLFENPQFRKALVLSEAWKIRPLPGQGFRQGAGR